MNRRAKLTPAMEANKWKKGQPSPNPSGGPKRKPIEEELLRLIDEKAGRKDKRSHARKIAEAMLKAAEETSRRLWPSRIGLTAGCLSRWRWPVRRPRSFASKSCTSAVSQLG